jgi:hypothetical protein
MGPPGATGTAGFFRRAGAAAAPGTVAAWSLGSVVGLPRLPVRDWITRYQPAYDGGVMRGGEDGPGDALVAILNAAAEAGSTRPAQMIAALEGGLETRFCSPVALSWAPDRHVAPARTDLVLVARARPPAAFNLGTEWEEVLDPAYDGPVHLVDPTLEPNRRAHPEVVEAILDRRYGLSCRSDYQDNDQAKIEACRRLA